MSRRSRRIRVSVGSRRPKLRRTIRGSYSILPRRRVQFKGAAGTIAGRMKAPTAPTPLLNADAPLRLPGRLETPGPRLTTVLVIPLVAIFGGLAYTAAVGKSATYDEPLHAVAGQVIRQTGDYRIDPEDGALFLRWSALLHGAKDIPLDLKDEDFNAVFHVPENQNTFLVHSRQWVFC